MVQHLLLLESRLRCCSRPTRDLALRALPPAARGLGRALVGARRFLSPAVCLALYA